jgi:hypothetical protein
MPALTLKYLNTLTPEEQQRAIVQEYLKCQNDIGYCMRTYFTAMDPKKGKRVLFDMYPYQEQAVSDFQQYKKNMTMKTRQTGLTTVCTVYAAAYMSLKKNQIIYALANKLKVSRKFLKMVRDVLDEARKYYPWLVPAYLDGNDGKDSFSVATGCTITAEPNTDEACRSETINLLFIDEVAAIDKLHPGRMEAIWASAGPTLARSGGTCIAISTPKGQSGWYYDQYIHAQENGWNIIEAHWSEHPDYRKGLYLFAKTADDKNVIDAIETYGLAITETKEIQGGQIIFFDEGWPNINHPDDAVKYKTKDTYHYILDGKLRSPWYDVESKGLGPQMTKCELDCSFAGSGSEVLDAEVLRALSVMAQKHKPIIPPGKGIWKSYKEFEEPNVHHSYVTCVDTATGDGSDYSAFVVIDCQIKKVVATFKDQLFPDVFTDVVFQVGTRFNQAKAVVENAGGGLTVLLGLEKLKYPIYRHKLKSKDPTRRDRRSKLGLWMDEGVRDLSTTKLDEWIRTDEIKIFSEDLVAELHTWIWDKDGKRRHAPGKHDDLIMATAMGVYYIAYILEQQSANTKNMSTIMSVDRVGWGNKDNHTNRGFKIGYL